MKAILLAVLLAGCASVKPQTSDLSGLGGSHSKNVAVLIGAPNGLAGVPTDIRELTTIFADTSYGYNFEVAAAPAATAAEAIALTADAAADADSMFWYFSGHGSDGVMLAEDRTFRFREIAAAIKDARGNRPLKRLVVMIDSCLSGSFVNGSSPIVDENGVEVVPGDFSTDAKRRHWAEATIEDPMEVAYVDSQLYEQGMVMSASLKNENSADLGRAKGGAFTYALRMVMANLRDTKPLATLKDLADDTIVKTRREGGHTPVYKAYPSADVLNDFLFLYRTGNEQQPH